MGKVLVTNQASTVGMKRSYVSFHHDCCGMVMGMDVHFIPFHGFAQRHFLMAWFLISHSYINSSVGYIFLHYIILRMILWNIILLPNVMLYYVC
jgi:hypothetical protein